MHWRTCSRQPRGFSRYAIHRANVLKMALQFTGWQAMRPLGRVFCDRQDAGMRTSWRLRGLRAVALLMLALAWPAAASDDASGTLRIGGDANRSEEHTSELQSLMRISYAVFCLKKNKKTSHRHTVTHNNQ